MEILSHSNELRLYTRNVHLQLETRLIPIIRKVRTRSQYEFLLKTFYTFFAPLEKRLCTVSTLEQLTTALQLRKADSLYRDFISLNGSTENLALCENLPDCSGYVFRNNVFEVRLCIFILHTLRALLLNYSLQGLV